MKINLIKLSVILCVLAIGQSAFAQDDFELITKVEHDASVPQIGYEKWKLKSNDLTLIIHEDHSDPIAHVQVAYHVGSARESDRISGFAHFFEHMMFQGSKNIEDEEHFKIISENGGWNNAYTSFDKTVYIQTAPSNLTETMLYLEADRMGTHMEGFTQKKFENQRDAVKNEKKQRNDNVQYGLVSEYMFKTAFADHPYEWTPIGFLDDLDLATYQDLKNFFLRWYGPNNATVVVSGDVNPEEVKKWVAKYFASINKCRAIPKAYAPSPKYVVDQYITLKDKIMAPLTVMAFPTVKEFHPDRPALDILSDILGKGKNSPMYQSFIKPEYSFSASTSHFSLELSGLFQFSVASLVGTSPDVTEDRIRKVIEEFAAKGVTEEQVKDAKASYLTSAYQAITSVDSKAEILSHWNMMLGTENKYNLQDEIVKYEKVTPADVMRVFNKYINGQKAVILDVQRDENMFKEEYVDNRSVNPNANIPKKMDAQYKGLEYNPPKYDFDMAQKPSIPAAQPIDVPQYYETKFDNGLEIVGIESNETPLINIRFEIEGGYVVEDGKKVKVGVANLTSDMLNEGAGDLSAEEFSKALNRLGSSIYVTTGSTENYIYVTSLKDNLDETLKLLEMKLFKPRWDKDDFKRLKKLNLENINIQKNNPSYVMNQTQSKILWKDTRFEETATGSWKDCNKVKLEDCESYYNEYFAPQVTTLAIVGDISQEDAFNKLSFLKNWKKTSATEPTIDFKPQMVDKTKIYLIDKPGATQTTISCVHPVEIPFDYKGESYKASLMNFALGGAFNSRINLNLREDKGYTYGARSYVSVGKHYGLFGFSSEIKREATDSAIMELMKEINNYIATGITDEELEFTKNAILLSDALDYETNSDKLGFLTYLKEYDLPNDYPKQQSAVLKTITKEEINNLAKKHLKPNKMLIVMAGHGYRIRKNLKKLGYEVIDID